MSNLCWQDQIFQTLKRLNSADQRPRLVVMGVGHELRGDDAVGIYVLRKMRRHIPMNEGLLLIDAGLVPENFCGTLRHFSPSLVLVIDAAHMGLAPGAVRWLDWKQVGEAGVSTHAPSLLILAEYLVRELGCQMALLGIEPADISFDRVPSSPVKHAFQEVSSFMIDLLSSFSEDLSEFNTNQRLLSVSPGSEGVWNSKYFLDDKEAPPYEPQNDAKVGITGMG